MLLKKAEKLRQLRIYKNANNANTSWWSLNQRVTEVRNACKIDRFQL